MTARGAGTKKRTDRCRGRSSPSGGALYGSKSTTTKSGSGGSKSGSGGSKSNKTISGGSSYAWSPPDEPEGESAWTPAWNPVWTPGKPVASWSKPSNR